MAFCLIAETDRVTEIPSTNGTGGYRGPRTQSRFEPRTHPPRVYDEKIEGSSQGIEPPSDQLRFIRQTLKLNMSDLALALGVSRPTVYAWLDGDEPSPENYTQIVRLKRVADEVESLDIPKFDKLAKRPIFNGLSFFEKLQAMEEKPDHFSTLKQLADKENSKRKARKGSGKAKDDSGFVEQATPIYESS